MAAPVYLTKGELRSKLLIRLGFGGLGSGAGAFVPYADDLLEEAQQQIYLILPDDKRVREWPDVTGIGQRWYDIPTSCDIDLITGVYARETSDSEWIKLDRGIPASLDNAYDDTEDAPQVYDIRYNSATSKSQIEIWPKPDEAYEWKIEGKMDIDTFVSDSDRASIDSRLILLYAIAYGKAHLGRKDADAAMGAWNSRKTQLKANQHGTREYIRRNPTKPDRVILQRPKVV